MRTRSVGGAVGQPSASHVFVVYAHPKRDSFVGAILDRFLAGLQEAGHTYELSDLYAENFNPTFSASEFDYFRGDGTAAADIAAIHERISAAQCLAFVFPVWWRSAPAVLKGWFDRVLINNFAYLFDGHEVIPNLDNKSVIMLCPAGSSTKTYQKHGYDGVIQRQIEAGIWLYCGLDDVQTHLMADVDASADDRARHLERAHRIGHSVPMRFVG